MNRHRITTQATWRWVRWTPAHTTEFAVDAITSMKKQRITARWHCYRLLEVLSSLQNNEILKIVFFKGRQMRAQKRVKISKLHHNTRCNCFKCVDEKRGPMNVSTIVVLGTPYLTPKIKHGVPGTRTPIRNYELPLPVIDRRSTTMATLRLA